MVTKMEMVEAEAEREVHMAVCTMSEKHTAEAANAEAAVDGVVMATMARAEVQLAVGGG